MSTLSHAPSRSQSPTLKIIREDGAAYDTGKSPRKFAPMIPPDLICPEINANAVQLYCLLAGYADTRTGLCEVAYTTIKERVGMSRPTVWRALQQLQHFGFVEVINRHEQNLCNQYKLPQQIRSRTSNHDSPQNSGSPDHVSKNADHVSNDAPNHSSPVNHLTDSRLTDLKQTATTDTRRRTRGYDASPPSPSWIDLFADDFDALADRFRRADPTYDESLICQILRDAQDAVGTASRDEITKAIRKTIATIETARRGGKVITSPRRFAAKVLSSTIEESREVKPPTQRTQTRPQTTQKTITSANDWSNLDA